jgi:hypothetical protein
VAFRIHDSVVRGEMDNRVKGLVRGTIFVHGRTAPIILQLKGNACADLAGCVLKFQNRFKPVEHPNIHLLNPRQEGAIGDLTASRKVRVFDVPVAEALAMCKRKETPPEHLANCVYLEWFSEADGRVVIESTDFEIEISAPLWRLSEADEAERARQAGQGMVSFVAKLSAAIDLEKARQKSPEEPWDEHDYEKLLRESDARTDKLMELAEKYGDDEDKIAELMGWKAEDDEEHPTDDSTEKPETEEEIDLVDLKLPEPDPAREGIDWVRDEVGEVCHPLQHRCASYASKYFRLIIDSKDAERAPAFNEFVFEFQTTAAKLAGALNVIAEGVAIPEPAFTIACLKRALSHLHRTQRGLED